MAGLMEATEPRFDGEGFIVELDPAWDIWGPAGGYLAAIALRVVRERAGAGQRPVTLTGQFVSVARLGALNVEITPIKPGGTSLFTVALRQEGRTVFLAQVWTTCRTDRCHATAPVMPVVPPPEDCTDVHEFFANRGRREIAFWANLDARLVDPRFADDPPAADPRQLRWMRLRDWAATTDPFLDAMRAALLIDIGIWPAHWHRLTEPAAYSAPSLDLAVRFHGGEPAGDWLLSEADADVAGHGTLSGSVRIWSQDGRAIATGGGQCLVVAPKAAKA